MQHRRLNILGVVIADRLQRRITRLAVLELWGEALEAEELVADRLVREHQHHFAPIIRLRSRVPHARCHLTAIHLQTLRRKRVDIPARAGHDEIEEPAGRCGVTRPHRAQPPLREHVRARALGEEKRCKYHHFARHPFN